MDIVYFLVYLFIGYMLTNTVLGFSSDNLDTPDGIAAYTVILAFWPMVLISMIIICIMEYFGGDDE